MKFGLIFSTIVIACLCESRAIHEVKEIAVVGAKVQHGRSAGPAVSLLDDSLNCVVFYIEFLHQYSILTSTLQ